MPPWAYILIGAIFIGFGGIVATYGWNLITSNEAIKRANDERTDRRRAMLRTLAAEVVLNKDILSDRKFTETDPEKLREYAIFPRPQFAGLQTAIASGVFASAEDRELFTAILSLQDLFADFNNRLHIIETEMLLPNANIPGLRSRLRDGALLASTRKGLAVFGQLMRKHGINPDEEYPLGHPPGE